ncbi:hypothetical protein MnTg03_00848 [bacterium MnTg03]|nr:hypothetical protein MnTg03_00848 [bacterium MnTg03]
MQTARIYLPGYCRAKNSTRFFNAPYLFTRIGIESVQSLRATHIEQISTHHRFKGLQALQG